MHLSQHMIASGWNAADEDMEFIGELEAGDGIQFSEPVGADHGYVEGKTILRLDGLTTTAGKNRQVFVLGMTFAQYQFAKTTFCAGGYSGKVTVKTRWWGNSFTKFNCYLRLQSEGMDKVWSGFKAVEWTYSDLRAVV